MDQGKAGLNLWTGPELQLQLLPFPLCLGLGF